MSPSPTPGEETAREAAHNEICRACKSTWCWFPDATNSVPTVHGEACDSLTRMVETREAALRARIGELEMALREVRRLVITEGDMEQDIRSVVDRALGTPKESA